MSFRKIVGPSTRITCPCRQLLEHPNINYTTFLMFRCSCLSQVRRCEMCSAPADWHTRINIFCGQENTEIDLCSNCYNGLV